jgi:peptidyl-prolyl cis-trans isomerase A (cyclophilin A)
MALVALGACGSDVPEPAPSRLDLLADPGRLVESAPETFRARFETTAGPFVVEVHRAWAPLGADRFYNLVKGGYYDSVYVHRVVPGQIAQFGIHGDRRVQYVWERSLLADDPPVESNTRGRISFGHAGPNSRATQVFVNLEDNPTLDADGFAPFGEVVEGMEAVDAFYAEYGDGPPRGTGPYAAQAANSGNAYFEENFPELTLIVSARLL